MLKKGFRCITSYGTEKEPARAKPNPNGARPVPDFMDADTIARHTTCTSKAYQKAKVSVPIAVKPFSEAGPARTYCNSKPVLKEVRCNDRFHRYDFCDDTKDFEGYGCGDKSGEEVCYFIFTQEICIEVPIRFGAVAHADQAWVECREASNQPCPDQELNNCGTEDQDEDEDEDEWEY